MAEDGADFLDVAGGEGAVLFDGFEEVLRPEFAGKFVVGFVDFFGLVGCKFREWDGRVGRFVGWV